EQAMCPVGHIHGPAERTRAALVGAFGVAGRTAGDPVVSGLHAVDGWIDAEAGHIERDGPGDAILVGEAAAGAERHVHGLVEATAAAFARTPGVSRRTRTGRAERGHEVAAVAGSRRCGQLRSGERHATGTRARWSGSALRTRLQSDRGD